MNLAKLTEKCHTEQSTSEVFQKPQICLELAAQQFLCRKWSKALKEKAQVEKNTVHAEWSTAATYST